MNQGPMPAAVYWRRRLIVLALLLAGIWLALRLTAGDESPAAGPTPTAAPKPPPAVVPTNGAFEVALASDDRACDPEKVRIIPSIPSGQFTGAAVMINLVVSSTEKAPCTLQPSDADLIVVISAKDTPVFDSTLCASSLLTQPVQLAGGGWATIAPMTWTGRGSGRTCARNEKFAGPGRYTVQVGTLGGEPGKATFALKARPKPKATSKPTSTPAAKK